MLNRVGGGGGGSISHTSSPRGMGSYRQFRCQWEQSKFLV